MERKSLDSLHFSSGSSGSGSFVPPVDGAAVFVGYGGGGGSPVMHNCSMCLKPVNRCECGPGKVHEITVQEMQELREARKKTGIDFFEGAHYQEETVNHPSHYNRGNIETIDYLESTMAPEAFKGFLQGNILKYVSRYPLKSGVEDLRKAQWYLERLITFKLKQGTPAK